MNNAVFERNYGKYEKTQRYYTCHYRKKKNYLVSEPSYNTKTFFTENLLAIGMKKKQRRLRINLLI